MSSTSLTHEERTAAEQREADLHHVKLVQIAQISESMRLLQLEIPPPEQVKASRCVPQAGGFTITSTPEDAQHKEEKRGYLELAIQQSPKSPPAAWLWRPKVEILGSDVLVRVGGSFVWPPPTVDPAKIKRLVFVAGGVGINPLISILSHLHRNPQELSRHIEFLYTTRMPSSGNPSSILFLMRLEALFFGGNSHHSFKVFLTRTSTVERLGFPGHDLEAEEARVDRPAAMMNEHQIVRWCYGRIKHNDLLDAIGPLAERDGVVVYICGVPSMTDEFVALLRKAEGMEEKRVLCEKWW
ncbi:MAG: hypothetical protein Q9201_001888 [Fulgogasparrea decipioides]